MGFEVKQIGNHLSFSKRADPNSISTNKFKRMMTVFDLFPVVADFATDGIFDSDKAATFKVVYRYDEEIKAYQKICKSYGLDDRYAAVRLYTVEQTQVQEDITNEFQDSIIEQKINELSSNIRQYVKNPIVGALTKSVSSNTRDRLKSLGIDLNAESVNAAAKTSAEAFGGAVNAGLNAAGIDPSWSQTISKSLSTAITGGLEVITQGKSISLPKSWKNTTYEPNLNVVVNLVSPYGSPKAIQKFIVEPLLYLLLLVAPETVSGITFGDTRKLNILGFGASNMSYAFCQNLTISRNKTNIGFNAYKQPLSIEINMAFSPILPSFAAVNKFRADGNNSEGDPVGTIKQLKNENFTYYLEDVSSGMNTVGNTIKSLAPIPRDEVKPFINECDKPYYVDPSLFIGDAPTTTVIDFLAGIIKPAVEDTIKKIEDLTKIEPPLNNK
jgi:hypothetical protein